MSYNCAFKRIKNGIFQKVDRSAIKKDDIFFTFDCKGGEGKGPLLIALSNCKENGHKVRGIKLEDISEADYKAYKHQR
jgi:hypothetical protein